MKITYEQAKRNIDVHYEMLKSKYKDETSKDMVELNKQQLLEYIKQQEEELKQIKEKLTTSKNTHKKIFKTPYGESFW